jgi:hypothetical protein
MFHGIPKRWAQRNTGLTFPQNVGSNENYIIVLIIILNSEIKIKKKKKKTCLPILLKQSQQSLTTDVYKPV